MSTLTDSINNLFEKEFNYRKATFKYFKRKRLEKALTDLKETIYGESLKVNLGLADKRDPHQKFCTSFLNLSNKPNWYELENIDTIKKEINTLLLILRSDMYLYTKKMANRKIIN